MINVIGLGYIGLPTALILAASGQEVIGTDFNFDLVRKLKNNELTFEEKGLIDLFKQASDKGITFSTEYSSTNMYIITVPTPYVKANKKIDSSYVVKAVETVLEVCEDETVLVIESTVSPGTIDKYVRPVVEAKSNGKVVHIVHAPERILPGNMIHELRNNARTIGSDDEEIGAKVREVYQSFCEADIVVTDIRTAEMSKVVENTYRDINIAFANELAKIARFDDLDVYEIIKIANMHPRVNILNPGPGVGGHCISVDPWFLVGDYPELTNIISTARHINDSMPEFVLNRINEIMKENGVTDKKKVGLYGLTYKQDVDDTRESPTLQLFEAMERHLSEPLKVYDPMIKDKRVPSQVLNFEEFMDEIEILVIMVGHTHLKENIEKLSNKIIFDTQNIVPNAIKL